jgi:hypothetical protein
LAVGAAASESAHDGASHIRHQAAPKLCKQFLFERECCSRQAARADTPLVVTSAHHSALPGDHDRRDIARRGRRT